VWGFAAVGRFAVLDCFAPTVPARPVTLAPFRLPVEEYLGLGLRLPENQ
jgi:hypothetical protein